MTRPISKMDTLSPTNLERPKSPNPEAKDTALAVAAWLEEKKGVNVNVLDVSPFSSVADVMVIVTAQGPRHAQALADWLLEKFAENGGSYLGMEGYSEGLWILVDANDILIHIFQEETRKFYNLDGLWSQSRSLLPDANKVEGAAGASEAKTDAEDSSGTVRN
ncbi:ribosome silencing factor RsfS/YbeB/iojap [Desulfonatronum thiosulfatophilum]|uniref:Ribosomal silencing factor RsfS n=1 Tax=Desulfonatronum thiosulfatophilum TaxID=617002 RepID=A0A1G6C032_9BACT|nr:ribosome silencing factor [Desulfonatronum thiosulfatophilum]SDB26230.1 ribosome silencing factor RsfS/YbeB/iojap [Desulfonatronum thiosulfatophilum]